MPRRFQFSRAQVIRWGIVALFMALFVGLAAPGIEYVVWKWVYLHELKAR